MSAKSGSLFDITLYLEKYCLIIRRKSVVEQKLDSKLYKKNMFFIPTLNTPFHLVSLSPWISCLHSLVNMVESEVKISAFVFACHPYVHITV